MNKEKTGDYRISNNSNEDWKKCNILGSLLDTERDIGRRKGLAIYANKNCEDIFKCNNNNNNNHNLKFRIFTTYNNVYSCITGHLQILTTKPIDVFQRKLLRKIL